MSDRLRAKIDELRDVGDALRSTNLLRGRQIHQLADDIERLAALTAQPDATAPAPPAVAIEPPPSDSPPFSKGRCKAMTDKEKLYIEYAVYCNHCAIQKKVPLTWHSWKRARPEESGPQACHDVRGK